MSMFMAARCRYMQQAAKRVQNTYNVKLGMKDTNNKETNIERCAKMGRDFHVKYGTLYEQRHVHRARNCVMLPTDLVSWLQREKQAAADKVGCAVGQVSHSVHGLGGGGKESWAGNPSGTACACLLCDMTGLGIGGILL